MHPNHPHTALPLDKACVSEWTFVASFQMKSYTSSSTFATIDLPYMYFFMSYSPLLKFRFPDFFLAMLSHIWMEVGSKLWHEELKIKVKFRHCWPTLLWVIAIFVK